MRCVVGLGNPGRKYIGTRHNVGYMVLEELLKGHSASFQEYGFSDVAHLNLVLEGKQVEVLLVKPMTYMNRSGKAVEEILADFPLRPGDILVIHDDMDLPFGKIRIKRDGSSGGHRGVDSIIDSIGTKEFPRLKIGIGRPEPLSDPVEHVLEPFNEVEMRYLPEVMKLAGSAVLDIMVYGIDQAMSRYNGKEILEDEER